MNEILTKVCFKCKKEKTLENFYKHKQMSLGVVNKCKECNKNDVRLNYLKKSENLDFIVKERERSKEKYHRLNYKEKQKDWDKNKNWKNKSIYKTLRSKFKDVPDSHHLHHWNYNDEFLEDVIVIERFNHRRAHNFIFLDLELKIYRTIDNDLLDTKEKHINYLLSKQISFD
jgi:L-rhamnose mutarotase